MLKATNEFTDQEAMRSAAQPDRFYVARWTTAGALLGIASVLGAWQLGVAELGDVTFLELHQAMPIMWIIDLAPTVLGIVGAAIGVLHQRLQSGYGRVAELAHDIALAWTADLHAANTELATALHERERFYASVTHELRTPLSAIIGYSELAENLAIQPTEASTYIQEIYGSATFLLGIINDLLDAAKTSHHGVHTHIEDVDAHRAITEMATLLRPLADSKGIRIQVTTPPRQYVRADPKRLRQVLTNLIANAIKYSDNGTITITTSTRHDQLDINIADQGAGLQPTDLERIFEPFTEAHGGERYDSTGLGLAVSRTFVEAMKGTLTASSNGPGTGSTFHISLPHVNNQQTEHPELVGTGVRTHTPATS